MSSLSLILRRSGYWKQARSSFRSYSRYHASNRVASQASIQRLADNSNGTPGARIPRNIDIQAAKQQQQQKQELSRRYITTYIKDVFRTGSLTPGNPILECIQVRQQQNESLEEGMRGEDLIPNFDLIRPHNIQAALDAYPVSKIQDELQNLVSSNVESISASATEQLQFLLQKLELLQVPIQSLQNTSAALLNLAPTADKREWKPVAVLATERLEQQEDLIYQHTELMQLVEKLVQQVKDAGADTQTKTNVLLLFAANRLLEKCKQQNQKSVVDDKERYEMLLEAFGEVKSDLKNAETPKNEADRKFLQADMYQYIGIASELATKHGNSYSNIAERAAKEQYHVLANDDEDSSKQYIQDKLYKDITSHLVPMLSEVMGVRKSDRSQQSSSSSSPMMDDFLKPTGAPANSYVGRKQQQRGGAGAITTLAAQFKKDEQEMLRLEHHVTLEGALQVLFRLAHDMMGVTIVKAAADNGSMGWHQDVQLFHVYQNDSDEDEYLGSFFLDPFQREHKVPRCATMPLLSGTEPVVVMALTIEPPAWDTDPARLTWDDCSALFHELGHVLQYLRPGTTAAKITTGPEQMPFDFTEFLPKFMEHWLTEKSTLYALIDMSQSQTPFSDEEIEAAFRVQSKQKALQLTQLVFYGALEAALFTNFDVRGKESMLAVQSRLADELIPHDAPDSSDMTPLLDIFQENAGGRQAAWYRYVWCDCLSAVLFDRIKDMYTNDPQTAMSKIQKRLQKHLLEPGAAIDVDAFLNEFGMTKFVSPADALFERYKLQKWEILPDETSESEDDNEEEEESKDETESKEEKTQKDRNEKKID